MNYKIPEHNVYEPIIKNILFICACILTISCGRDIIDEILDRTENIVAGQPDSALILLDSVENMITTPKQQVRYNLLALYAKDLNDEDISTDRKIIYVTEHLKKVSNSKYMALAEYYMGRVYQAQGNLEQAMIFYLKARISAKKSDDDNINGLICSYIAQQHFNNKDYDNAIDNLKSSFKYFNRSQENYKRKMTVLNNIGNCYIYKKMKDSAVIYYNEAIELAKTAKDSVTIIQNLGMAYLKTNEPDKAKQQLFVALNMSMDSIMKSSIYLNIGKIYERKRLLDSAVYYVKLSVNFHTPQTDILTMAANYKILSRLEHKRANYYEALRYSNMYIEHDKKIKEKNVPDIEKIEMKNKLHIFQRKQQHYMIIKYSCLCLAAVIIVVLYIGYLYNKKLKKKIVRNN
jgi:tetratricopeptide (TPR) repeat protein